MSKTLTLYSTTDGHTKIMSQKVQSVAERLGHFVVLYSIEDPFRKGLGGFDKIVIGASTRYGIHNKKVFLITYEFPPNHMKKE